MLETVNVSMEAVDSNEGPPKWANQNNAHCRNQLNVVDGFNVNLDESCDGDDGSIPDLIRRWCIVYSNHLD